jgi:hypothetical protein
MIVSCGVGFIGHPPNGSSFSASPRSSLAYSLLRYSFGLGGTVISRPPQLRRIWLRGLADQRAKRSRAAARAHARLVEQHMRDIDAREDEDRAAAEAGGSAA